VKEAHKTSYFTDKQAKCTDMDQCICLPPPYTSVLSSVVRYANCRSL